MKVSYRITPADHWALNRYVMTHDIRMVASILFAILVIPGVFLASTIHDGKSLGEAGGSAAFVVVAAVLLGYPVLRLMAWSKYRAMPRHIWSVTMTLNEAGVQIVTSKVNQTMKWNGVTKVRRDRRAIYLFISRRAGFIVPVRAFGGAADAAAFFDYAAQHAGR